MYDLNVKVETANDAFGRVTDNKGFGNMNENGDMFVKLSNKYDLVIGDTIFADN